MNSWLLIFLGGGLGSVTRYGVGKWMASVLPVSFPFGTLLANTFSALILGIFIGLTISKTQDENQLRFFVAVGFCGGFSTFSAFSAETFEMLRNGYFLYGGLNILVNVVVCLLMFGLGTWIVKILAVS